MLEYDVLYWFRLVTPYRTMKQERFTGQMHQVKTVNNLIVNDNVSVQTLLWLNLYTLRNSFRFCSQQQCLDCYCVNDLQGGVVFDLAVINCRVARGSNVLSGERLKYNVRYPSTVLHNL